ncbi:pterin-4-alpha-carbinolamine dehydratase [Mycobacterium tuberculosis CAS/NITR204]|uniref:Pterin-4-alpha-carbinolamine dehydratase n=1 Tax=Mycobacterium tuberculosis CAS/NITR204 TaxID=1310114 RepID=R4MBL2_MYCTX|nr:pterin-4-alpha-carbinolamine dehydratase [Mycobacterium tuberculosis CAS/NITR204]
MVGRALVVVVDDRTAHGDEDHSGPLVTELLTEAGFVVDGVVAVSADEVEIRNALNTAVIGGVDLVVSVGGTGVTPRDVTPEATRDILDREIIGIAEVRDVRAVRGNRRRRVVERPAGVSGSTLVVNLAGSRYAVRDGMWTASCGTDHRAVVELGDLNPDRVSGYCDSVLARGPSVGDGVPRPPCLPGESPFVCASRSRISVSSTTWVSPGCSTSPFLRSVL